MRAGENLVVPGHPAYTPSVATGADSQANGQQSAPDKSAFPYVFVWDRKGRKGKRCKTLRRGGMNSAAIEFEDGYQMVTSRNALRRAPEFALSVETKREKEVAENRQSRAGTARQARQYPSLPDEEVATRSAAATLIQQPTSCAEETR